MKLVSIYIALMLSGSVCSGQEFNTDKCDSPAESGLFKNREQIKMLLDEMAESGIPGLSVAVHSRDGWWTYNTGYADLGNRVPMRSCHLQYAQSVSKLYMATGILKLYELGRLHLDSMITRYLPEKVTAKIDQADLITVRMLLNHTSGIPDYNFSPGYVTYLLQHPDFRFTPEDYVRFVDGKPLKSTPGETFSYRNINYVLLAMIANELTGDHASWLDEVIFKPLRLEQTYYRNDPGYLEYPLLVQSYWDRYSNSVLENASFIQRGNVRSMIGDDGIVVSPTDAIRFLQGLENGLLLKPETYAEMKKWVKDRNGKPVYGLGMGRTVHDGYSGYGHSGGGIGAGCELRYYPEQDLYVFIAINLGTVTDSPIHSKLEGKVEALFRHLLD